MQATALKHLVLNYSLVTIYKAGIVLRDFELTSSSNFTTSLCIWLVYHISYCLTDELFAVYEDGGIYTCSFILHTNKGPMIFFKDVRLNSEYGWVGLKIQGVCVLGYIYTGFPCILENNKFFFQVLEMSWNFTKSGNVLEKVLPVK